MEERRPDPDILLEEMRRETERSREGKLKIFFGAAPGVGKTYAMLEAARQKYSEGINVIVGLVETHGRKETEALLTGLEILPRKNIEYRGAVMKEFDIDAALARKPAIILVDELAHTNSEGSRHKKRWQDIYELLGAGITVYTTMNVQHLESLNDVVAQITGINVRETVPDFLLDRADEIELVDLPPDDLLQRLAEGKVYVAELAAQARQNFFRKGNLLALRELALRRTAEQVDEQMQNYRRGKGVQAVWPAAERILVCVGPSPFAVRLIRAAKRMAAGLRADWIAVNVEAPGKIQPTERDIKGLAENMRLAESLGADTVRLSGHKASEEILNYARSRNVTKIIVGKPTHPRWKDKLFGSLLDEIVRGSGDIDVYVITGDKGEASPKQISKAPKAKTPPQDWIISIATVAGCTAVASLMLRHFEVVDIAMFYLLGVIFTAIRTSRGPALLASLLSVAAFDFFFVPPYFTFVVHQTSYYVTFIVMFIVASVISTLTLRIRDQAAAARLREKRTAALYSLSRELLREREIEKLSAIAVRHIGDIFSSEPVILVPDQWERLQCLGSCAKNSVDDKELSVAQWAYDHSQKAGIGTDTLSGSKALYIPLISTSKTVGVLGIIPADKSDFNEREQLHALEGFAAQTALAMERALLADEAQQAVLRAETETLRNTLLSSVSHDLRTPLAAITGAATTMLEKNSALGSADKHELALTIYEEAEHLNQIIRNVLDMTRLESGAITVKKEWQSLEEIVGAVLNRLSDKIKDRPVNIDLPADLPLVPFDPLLIEQVLMNLLGNAIKYTPPGSPIDISAHYKENQIFVDLADKGPGIPNGEEERIFDKFVRGFSAGGGIGLGLTICRAIIAAHGGRIWAENSERGGAVFHFTLPLAERPPMLAIEEDI